MFIPHTTVEFELSSAGLHNLIETIVHKPTATVRPSS
jgi:hypothetical protein